MTTSCVVFGVSAEKNEQCARETTNHSASIGAEVWGVSTKSIDAVDPGTLQVGSGGCRYLLVWWARILEISQEVRQWPDVFLKLWTAGVRAVKASCSCLMNSEHVPLL